MATEDKVRYVGPNGQERLVRAGNAAADTAARYDGFRPADEAPKPKPAAKRRPAAKKPAAKQPAAKPAGTTGDAASA